MTSYLCCYFLSVAALADGGLSSANSRYKEMVPTMVRKEADEEQNIDKIKKQQQEVWCVVQCVGV